MIKEEQSHIVPTKAELETKQSSSFKFTKHHHHPNTNTTNSCSWMRWIRWEGKGLACLLLIVPTLKGTRTNSLEKQQKNTMHSNNEQTSETVVDRPGSLPNHVIHNHLSSQAMRTEPMMMFTWNGSRSGWLNYASDWQILGLVVVLVRIHKQTNEKHTRSYHNVAWISACFPVAPVKRELDWKLGKKRIQAEAENIKLNLVNIHWKGKGFLSEDFGESCMCFGALILMRWRFEKGYTSKTKNNLTL